MKHSHNFIDLTGQKMHRLTFLHFVGRDDSRNSIWRVKCDCGTEFDVRACSVKYGTTRSCGCIKAEKNRARSKK